MKVGIVPFLTFGKKLGKRKIMIHDIIFCEVVFGIPLQFVIHYHISNQNY